MRVLVTGGAGFIGSHLVLVEGLTFPASVGESWMIGCLLSRGIRAEPTPMDHTGPHPSMTAATTTATVS